MRGNIAWRGSTCTEFTNKWKGIEDEAGQFSSWPKGHRCRTTGTTRDSGSGTDSEAVRLRRLRKAASDGTLAEEDAIEARNLASRGATSSFTVGASAANLFEASREWQGHVHTSTAVQFRRRMF